MSTRYRELTTVFGNFLDDNDFHTRTSMDSVGDVKSIFNSKMISVEEKSETTVEKTAIKAIRMRDALRRACNAVISMRDSTDAKHVDVGTLNGEEEERLAWKFLISALDAGKAATHAVLEAELLRVAVDLHYATARPELCDMFVHLSASEMFFIDGDSLFMAALSPASVDWDLIQPLHVMYNAQKILQDLQQRGGRFHVVFFEKALWMWEKAPKKLFMRENLRMALMSLSEGSSKSSLTVCTFPSYHSEEFNTYLQLWEPEFILMTDGEQLDTLTPLQQLFSNHDAGYDESNSPTQDSQGDQQGIDDHRTAYRSLAEDKSVGSKAALYYRCMLLWTTTQRLKVAYSSRIIYRENAMIVFTVRVDGSAFEQAVLIEPEVRALAQSMEHDVQVPVLSRESKGFLEEKVSFRERILYAALHAYLSAEKRSEPVKQMCQALVITVYLMGLLSNTSRAQSAEPNGILSEMLSELAPYFLAALRSANFANGRGQEFDLIDGHLFSAVARELRVTAAKDLLDEDGLEDVSAALDAIANEDGNAITALPLAQLPVIMACDDVPLPPHLLYTHEMVEKLSKLFGITSHKADKPFPSGFGAANALAGWDITTPFDRFNDVIDAEGTALAKSMMTEKEAKKAQEFNTKFVRNAFQQAQTMGIGSFAAQELAVVCSENEDDEGSGGANSGGAQKKKVSKAHAGQRNKKSRSHEDEIRESGNVKSASAAVAEWHKQLDQIMRNTDISTDRVTNEDRTQAVNSLKKLTKRLSEANLGKNFDPGYILKDTESGVSMKLAMWRVLVAASKLREVEFALTLFDTSLKNKEGVVKGKAVQKDATLLYGFAIVDRVVAGELAQGQLEPLFKARPDMTSAEAASYLRWTYLSYVEQHIQMKLRCRVVRLLLDTWRGERERARLAKETPSIPVSIPLFLYCHHSVLSLIRDEGLQISEKDLEIVRSALAYFDFPEDYYTKVDQAITKWQNKAPETLSPSLLPPHKQLHETPEHLQLMHMGHLLERPFMRKRDYRVAFNPDNWQRELLDIVDSRGSAVVCAPTSAGKTFISYYCMFNALRRSNTRVVVYLAPARALINQAVADVCARYGSKKYKNPGTNIYGVLGGADYHQFHDCCQVLLTVPEAFETMLLSAKYVDWVDRIDYVILDEIHSMESSGNGDVWERILALLPCPFVALSATLGETQQLCDWLNRTQGCLQDSKSVPPATNTASGSGKPRDYNVHLLPSKGKSIQRWNDIKKYIYLPPPGTIIRVKKLTSSYEHRFIRDLHPLSILSTDILRRGFPPDISLVPSEVIALYEEMLETFKKNVWTKWSTVQLVQAMNQQLAQLEPAKYFEEETYITQELARKYEADVKNAFAYWVFLSYESDEHLDELDDEELDEFNATMKLTTDSILHSFAQQLAEDESALESHAAAAVDKHRALQRQQHKENEKTGSVETEANTALYTNSKDEVVGQSPQFPGSRQYIRDNIMGVLREILARDMGPTIVFSFESEDCGDLAKWAVEQLEDAEARFRKSEEFAIYKAKMERNAAAQATRRKQRESTLKQKRLTKDDDGNNERAERDVSDVEAQEESFVIPDVLPEFTFIGDKCSVDPIVINSLLKDCEDDGEDLLLRALRRGIGIHHAGVRGKLRGHVERLFRGRHCGVIFSTETLALGIHSPCRSVVLAGDHILLNPTQFRQMMGRAGRRGLDYLGHLIFIGISMRRIKRLMTSSMTVIKGNVQMDPLSQLRLLQLYDYNTHRRLKNEGQWKAYVMKLAERLFTNPLFFEGRAAVAGGNMEELTIEFLQMLLGYFQKEGLHYNEYTSSLGSLLADVMYVFREAHVGNEGFAFIKMLTSGVFDQASYPTEHSKKLLSGVTDEPIVELLAYLFSTHQMCGLPLEVHRSVLLDPAVSTVWDGKTGTTQHRVVLTPLHLCSPIKALDNTDFWEILSSFYNYLASKLETPALNALCLPYMRSDKKQRIFAKADADFPLVDNLKKTMVSFKARSPFVAISGCGDRFTSVDEIVFTLRDGLFCDRRMLPILDLTDGWRHDKAQILINACLADFLRVKAQIDTTRKNYRFTMLEEFNGLSQSLSYAVLNKVEKLLSNLAGTFRRAKLPPASVLLTIMPGADAEGGDTAGAPRVLQVAERLNALQLQIQKRFAEEIFAAKMAKWTAEKAVKQQ